MKKNQKPPKWNIFRGNSTAKSLVTGLCIAGGVMLAASALPSWAEAAAPAEMKKPNIVVIMADDIGIWNIGAYHQGVMSGKTPNLDKLAAQGMRFTDYYAEASCTAGRSNFITGELPIRTGLTTVGQAGADVGMPDKAPTIATALKSMGYATGQFGKNHLGDLNKYLPTLHGFDEFQGYLYHLDAMEDPFHFSYPKDPSFAQTVGPRNVLHCWATDKDDPTEMPRWGVIGKQKIVDEGPLPPHPIAGIKYNMETVDDVFLKSSLDFIDKSKAANKPFFVWLNPTRMHIFTHLSEKYASMQTAESNYGMEEAGMAQVDDIVGNVMKHLEAIGEADNTILLFTTDNGTEVFTWPDGGMTPYRAAKGTVFEGGFRVPAIVRWPGKIKPGTVENGIFSSLDWFPTLVAAAGNPNLAEELKKGKQLGDKTYKVYLDGYDQTPMLTGKGPSNRHEVWYFGESTMGAVRIDDFKYRFIDQPGGWPGPKVKLNAPTITNLRQDPFERLDQGDMLQGSPGYFNQFYTHEFWRFVFVQNQVKKMIETAIEFPPLQKGASFNLEAVKAQIEEAVRAQHGQ